MMKSTPSVNILWPYGEQKLQKIEWDYGEYGSELLKLGPICTTDKDTALYRSEALEELVHDPSQLEIFKKMNEILGRGLFTLSIDPSLDHKVAYLHILEANSLAETLHPRSQALQVFKNHINSFTNQEYLKHIGTHYTLDIQLKLNEKLEKIQILHYSFKNERGEEIPEIKNDDYLREKESLIQIFQGILGLGGLWRKKIVLETKNKENKALNIIQDLYKQTHVYTEYAEYFRGLKEGGIPLCRPEILESEEEIFEVEELFSPYFVYTSPGNTFRIGKEQNISTVSGSNSSGKTEFLKTIGITQMMAQSGLLVPAKKAKISIVHALKHYDGLKKPEKNETQGKRGLHERKFHELLQLFRDTAQYSMLLLDEPIIGTSGEQECFEVYTIMELCAQKGIRTLMATHADPLIQLSEDQEKFPQAKIYTMEMEGNKPTYRIKTGRDIRTMTLDENSLRQIEDIKAEISHVRKRNS